MPQRLCEWQDCEKPGAQVLGDCLICGKHFCRIHRRTPWHECPNPEENWEDYSAKSAAAEDRVLDELCLRVDAKELCARASALREDIPCTVDFSRQSLSTMMGGQNCHAEITFEDDVKQLARFRLVTASSPPQEVREWILRSEAATMLFLQQHTSIPTPKIFDWACKSDPGNVLGVDYILMEKLDGNALDWQAATQKQKEKVMQQLVDIFLEIENHPFGMMGSLAFSAGDAVGIQGLALQSSYHMRKGPLGPFSSSQEGAQALLESYLAMISSGEIDSYSPVDNYLVHKLRQEISSSLFTDPSENNQFFLKHPDDKGDHILVNDDFDIVGIIDWEWTHTVSKAEAFASPCMMWPVAEFYDGSNDLAAEELRLAEIFRERSREDLAECVLNSRKVQRFWFASGLESPYLNGQTFQALFTGFQRAFGIHDQDWETWKRKALAKWETDSLLSMLEEGLD